MNMKEIGKRCSAAIEEVLGGAVIDWDNCGLCSWQNLGLDSLEMAELQILLEMTFPMLGLQGDWLVDLGPQNHSELVTFLGVRSGGVPARAASQAASGCKDCTCKDKTVPASGFGTPKYYERKPSRFPRIITVDEVRIEYPNHPSSGVRCSVDPQANDEWEVFYSDPITPANLPAGLLRKMIRDSWNKCIRTYGG